jgi:hypothetical protein
MQVGFIYLDRYDTGWKIRRHSRGRAVTLSKNRKVCGIRQTGGAQRQEQDSERSYRVPTKNPEDHAYFYPYKI